MNNGFRLGRQECESVTKGLKFRALRINAILIIFPNQVHFHAARSKPKSGWKNQYCIIISTFALENKNLAHWHILSQWENDGMDGLLLRLALCPFSSFKMFNLFRSCRDKEH